MRDAGGGGYWSGVWREFRRDSLAAGSLAFIAFLVATAVFESFLAGNRPIVLLEEGRWYFPAAVDYPDRKSVV